MEKNVKENFLVNSFDEFPDGYIVIDKNSNYFYIEYLDEKYIVRENIDLITIINQNNENRILCEKSYYDVLNNDLVLTISSIYSMDNKKISSNISFDYKIVSLSDILKLKGNSKFYLSIEDVKNITNTKKPLEKKL